MYDSSVLYISDSPGNQIYKIDNYPGQSAKYSVFLDSTMVSSPTKLVVDGYNMLYFTEANKKTITKVTPARNIVDVISFPSILNPTSFTLAPDNKTFYILDTTHHSIYTLQSNGTVNLLAGGNPGSADGTGTAAQFNNPIDLVCDSKGNIYVTDTGVVGVLNILVDALYNWKLCVSAGTIRKITPAGVVTTFIKGLNHPKEICIDSDDNMYVSEVGGNIIRKVTPNGISKIHSGRHFIPSNDGSRIKNRFSESWGDNDDNDSKVARFRGIYGMAVDGQGTVYVSDIGNKRIRRIRSATGPVPQRPPYDGISSGFYSVKAFSVPR
jgi:sugar lactone lactonase YvrE